MEGAISEKYIARSSAIAARLLGGEMMIMSAVDSTFFTLNEVATSIWQAADGRTPLAQIVAGKVCTEFEVDQNQAQQDAEEFVDQLSKHGVLLVSEQPISTSPGALSGGLRAAASGSSVAGARSGGSRPKPEGTAEAPLQEPA